MDLDTAIIEPRKGKSEPNLPSSALLVFTPEDVDICLQRLDQSQQHAKRLYLSALYSGAFQGARVALTGPVIGAPQAVLVLEKLVALGASNIVALGWCGSLQPHVTIGDVVLPTAATSDEGTSKHYPTDLQQPGPAPVLVDALRQALRGLHCAVHQGTVWSTDAPYRETRGRVLALQKQGVLAVEMEASALFTVASFRGIQLAAVLAVSDELHDLKWRHGFTNKKFRQTREQLAELSLQAVCSVP
jgi:uridine phosphorylase